MNEEYMKETEMLDDSPVDELLTLPAVALRGLTVMPEMVIHFDISRKQSLEAVQKAMRGDSRIFLVTQKNVETAEPEQGDLYEVGVIAEVKQIMKLPKKITRVLVEGKERGRMIYMNREKGYVEATVQQLFDGPADSLSEINVSAMVRGIKELFLEYASLNKNIAKEVTREVIEAESLYRVVTVICANFPLPYQEIQKLLEIDNLLDRYEAASLKLASEIQILNLKEDIEAKVKERVDKHQREYILREQMKVIREELGEDTVLSDAEEFEEAIRKMKAPKAVKEKLKKELGRYKLSMNNSAENGVIRTYLETMLEMPWDKKSSDSYDLKYAEEILEKEHYGLEKVKERVLEYLAVRALTKKGDSPILCLYGPPGTGKTSIARSLARSMKKPYVRVSLGGVRDEAEIRGHRKTYVGAMPGRIANGIRQAGVKNPLILLDEIDKVSTDYKGDTFSALLEVLDSEQNHAFRDHYLEVPLDLSEVLFVTTANTLDTIPRPLLDRMEVIEVGSYTENEKVHIAERHLIPKQLEHHGLDDGRLTFTRNAVKGMISGYTREAGVRQLERKIGEICRKAAKEIYSGDKKSVRVREQNLTKYLGKEKYLPLKANENDEVGIVRGLAWTSVGGTTLEIEVNTMPGKGEIMLTGQLGDVMKESARIGMTYIRSVGEKYEIDEKYFSRHDVHIHIPEGAVPKDGPSAGITMATAVLSAVTGRKVRANLAMTGEVTLRGRVLAIGGLKEKLLAAKKAGITKVLVPKENKRDVAELDGEITKGMDISFVSEMDEVLKAALV